MKEFLVKNKKILLCIFAVLIILGISIFIVFCTLKQKNIINKLDTDNYSLQYDNTWEIIRKEKLSVSEIEDAIQSSSGNGSIGLINSLAQLYVDDVITLEQAKAQIEEKNIEILNRTIMQLKMKREDKGSMM